MRSVVRYRILIPDLRGTGVSGEERACPTIALLAAVVRSRGLHGKARTRFAPKEDGRRRKKGMSSVDPARSLGLRWLLGKVSLPKETAGEKAEVRPRSPRQ